MTLDNTAMSSEIAQTVHEPTQEVVVLIHERTRRLSPLRASERNSRSGEFVRWQYLQSQSLVTKNGNKLAHTCTCIHLQHSPKLRVRKEFGAVSQPQVQLQLLLERRSRGVAPHVELRHLVHIPRLSSP